MFSQDADGVEINHRFLKAMYLENIVRTTCFFGKSGRFLGVTVN